MGLTFLLSQFSEGGGGPVDFTHTHYTTGTGMSINAVPGTPRVASVSPGAGGGGLNNNNKKHPVYVLYLYLCKMGICHISQKFVHPNIFSIKIVISILICN